MDSTFVLIASICLVLFSIMGWFYLAKFYAQKIPVKLSKNSRLEHAVNPVLYDLWHAVSCLMLCAGPLVIALELIISWYADNH